MKLAISRSKVKSKVSTSSSTNSKSAACLSLPRRYLDRACTWFICSSYPTSPWDIKCCVITHSICEMHVHY